MATMRTVKLVLALTAALLTAAVLQGCGAGSQSLTGGSVPLGGRALTGSAVLPDGTAASNAKVTVRSLPSETVIETVTTDANGHFTCSGIPTNGDISIVVSEPPSSTLEAVIPQSTLVGNPGPPVNIGSVTALTTLVAAAIHLERGPAPEDTNGIIANQQPHLDMEAHDANYSLAMQNQFIQNPNSLNAEALTLIVPTANTELAAFAAQPTSDTSSAALNGVLGYLRAAHMRDIHISGGNRNDLVASQLAEVTYTPDAIAAALQKAGVPGVTAVEATSASQRERTELTALSNLGAGIGPLEALVIAADIRPNGGFQLDQNPLDTFLSTLLKQ